MDSYTFEYTGISIPPSDPFPTGHIVYRPLLRARVVNPATKASLRCIVCADTGADHCVFPLSFAAAIGLDPLQMKMQHTAGVGNSGVATYYGSVRIEIPIRVGASLTFSTIAGFTVGMDHVGFGLLGQTGFFERFPTTFNYPDKTFTVKA